MATTNISGFIQSKGKRHCGCQKILYIQPSYVALASIVYVYMISKKKLVSSANKYRTQLSKRSTLRITNG